MPCVGVSVRMYLVSNAAFTLCTRVSDLGVTWSDWPARRVRRCLKSGPFLNFLRPAMEPTERIDPQCVPRAPHASPMSCVDGRVIQCECGVSMNVSSPRTG